MIDDRRPDVEQAVCPPAAPAPSPGRRAPCVPLLAQLYRTGEWLQRYESK